MSQIKVILVNNPFNWKKPTTILWALIRAYSFPKNFSGFKYNHVAILFTSNTEFIYRDKAFPQGDYVFETLGKGVILNTLYNWQKRDLERKYQIIEKSSLFTKEQVQFFILNCHKWLDGYEYFAYLKHLTQDILIKILGSYAPKINSARGKITCIDLVQLIRGKNGENLYKLTDL